jgi:RNA polymerase sigma factor (sigma-70 family)
MPRSSNGLRSLTTAALGRLLNRLHADTDRAAEEYERLRRSLVKFFDWRGAWPADECADEALDRLALKLEQETVVEDVQRYAYGIARMVLLEWQRRPMTSSIDSDAALAAAVAEPPDESEQRSSCLDQCLSELPVESRSVILDYYDGERSVKISPRRRIAAALGLSDNALRSRVQRLRERLEACVHECISESR